MRAAIFRFCAEERGATLIEYGLLFTLLSIATIATASTLGENMASIFEDEIVETLENANAGGEAE